jgi:hypothetical protein
MKKEDLQAALEAISKSGIQVAGDLVLEKNVEYEVANVEEGGIGIQINNGNSAKASSTPEVAGGVVPERLKTEEAEELMDKLVDAGMLTEEWQANGLSCSERALLAKNVCDKLKINDVWQVFGMLWNERPETLRSYFNKALDQKKSLKYQDKLKNVLG